MKVASQTLACWLMGLSFGAWADGGFVGNGSGGFCPTDLSQSCNQL